MVRRVLLRSITLRKSSPALYLAQPAELTSVSGIRNPPAYSIRHLLTAERRVTINIRPPTVESRRRYSTSAGQKIKRRRACPSTNVNSVRREPNVSRWRMSRYIRNQMSLRSQKTATPVLCRECALHARRKSFQDQQVTLLSPGFISCIRAPWTKFALTLIVTTSPCAAAYKLCHVTR